MEVLYNAQGLMVTHDAPNDCLLVEWSGSHDGPAKIACSLVVLDLIERTNATKGLVNGTHDLDGWNEAVEWLGHVHQSALAALGIVAIAWVLPRNLTARQHVERVIDLIIHPVVRPPHKMIYNTFDDVEAAYSWLIHRAVPAAASQDVLY